MTGGAAERGRGGFGSVLLVVAILVVLGLSACIVPFMRCPACAIRSDLEVGVRITSALLVCGICGDRGRVSVKDRWDWGRARVKRLQ